MFGKDYDRGIINVGNFYRFHKVFDKLTKGENVTVVFLGGSITQDCSATKHELGYAYRTFEHLNTLFPQSEIKYINAGIGSTTSELGIARVESDVLSHKPDIVFIEFSVNDSSESKFMDTFECLIRKVLLSETEPAVFTFNNVCYDTGINAQEIHNTISKYYDIPTISIKESVYEEILLGNFKPEVLTADYLHPNNLGHKLIANTISNLIDIIYSEFLEGNVCTDKYIVPEKPYTELIHYNSVRFDNSVSNDETFSMANVTVDEREQYEVKDCFKKGFIFESKDSYISFNKEFRGLSIVFTKTHAKNSPIADVYVDGLKVSELDGNFDETWGDLICLQNIVQFDSSAEHKIEVRIDDYPENNTQKFYLISFITY